MHIMILVFVVSVASNVVPKLVFAQENTSIVTEYQNQQLEGGGYLFRYVLSDGTKREETGSLDADGNLVVSGLYSYIDPSGKEHSVEYYADSTGYHPQVGGLALPPTIVSLPPGLVASLLGG